MQCRCQLLSITLLFVSHTKTLKKTDKILTKERFLLFSQSCLLGNTTDLLHFMLHRVLSVTSVKIVCCLSGIPHSLRDELTCGSFQLSNWGLNVFLFHNEVFLNDISVLRGHRILFLTSVALC